MKMRKWVFLFCLASLLLPPGLARADIIYEVTLNTAPLAAAGSAGPFSLDFQLTDGSGTNDANNTATLNNFKFGGGAPDVFGTGAFDQALGGASGDLGSTITLTDSSFLNEFTQQFTPGSTLSFRLRLTTNVDAGGTPDEFSFDILDGSGVNIPMSDPRNAFLIIDINSSTNPQVQTFGNDPTTPDSQSGQTIGQIDPPNVSTAVPEPGTLTLLAMGVLGLCAWSSSKRGARNAKHTGPA